MSARTVHINAPRGDRREAVEALRRHLLTATASEITAADASVLSGLALEECEPALLRLASEYPSRLRVTEEGMLLFRFDSLERTRDPGGVVRLFRKGRQLLWRARDYLLGGFTLLIVPWMLLILSVHLLIFCEAIREWSLMAGIVAWTLIGPFLFFVFLFGFLGLVIFGFFPIAAVTLVLVGIATLAMIPAIWYLGLTTEDAFHLGNLLILTVLCLTGGIVSNGIGGALLRMCWVTAREMAGGVKVPAVREFWRNTGGFLFGPPGRPPRDPEEERRRVVALIREKQGILCRADLMALFGCDVAEADQEVTRLLIDFGGDIAVTDEGVLLYRFESLMDSAGEVQSQVDMRAAFQKEDGPSPFFGISNQVAGLLLILFACGFAGLAVLRVDSGVSPWNVDLTGSPGPGRFVLELLSVSPALYMMVVAILIARVPVFFWRRWRERRRLRFFELLRVAILRPAGSAFSEGFESRDIARLGGTIEPSEDATTALELRFPEIALEQRVVARARQAVRQQEPGAVVFDSESGIGTEPCIE
jgi:hypothetical protein